MASDPAIPAPTAASAAAPAHPHGHDPVTQTLALLQPWIDYVPQQQRRLGLFICLAVALHALAFFFLRIDNSVAELRHPPRTHVSVAYPQALAADGSPPDSIWDRLTDPRVFLRPTRQPAEALAGPVPIALDTPMGSGRLPDAAPPESYHAAGPVARPVEQQAADAMVPPRQAFTYIETPPAIAAGTTWQWDAPLAARQPGNVPELPSPTSDTDLSPTKLRLAVGPSGTVEHVLVDQSSAGELGAIIAKDLDQQAVLAAQKIRFQPAGQPGLQWGRATIFWRYAAPPREEVVPTPPTAPGGE